MSYGNPGGGDPLPDWPQEAIAAIASAMYINTGNELEPITGVYRPEGQAVVILAALARVGFDVRSTLVTPEAVAPEALAEYFHSELLRHSQLLGLVGVPLRDKNGRCVDVAVVDEVDSPEGRWYLSRNGYAASQFGYLHRLINNTTARLDTDHVNGDRLDDRRVNLRTKTRQGNAHNVGATNGTPRGVAWHKASGRWRAYGSLAKRQYHLGLHDTLEQAAQAARVWRARMMPDCVEPEDRRHLPFPRFCTVPWASVPEDNRRLMQAVAGSVMLRFFPQHIAIAHDPEMHQHTSVCGEWCGR